MSRKTRRSRKETGERLKKVKVSPDALSARAIVAKETEEKKKEIRVSPDAIRKVEEEKKKEIEFIKGLRKMSEESLDNEIKNLKTKAKTMNPEAMGRWALALRELRRIKVEKALKERGKR